MSERVRMRSGVRGHNDAPQLSRPAGECGTSGEGCIRAPGRAGFAAPTPQLDFRTSDGRACVGWIVSNISSFFHSAF